LHFWFYRSPKRHTHGASSIRSKGLCSLPCFLFCCPHKGHAYSHKREGSHTNTPQWPPPCPPPPSCGVGRLREGVQVQGSLGRAMPDAGVEGLGGPRPPSRKVFLCTTNTLEASIISVLVCVCNGSHYFSFWGANKVPKSPGLSPRKIRPHQEVKISHRAGMAPGWRPYSSDVFRWWL